MPSVAANGRALAKSAARSSAASDSQPLRWSARALTVPETFATSSLQQSRALIDIYLSEVGVVGGALQQPRVRPLLGVR